MRILFSVLSVIFFIIGFPAFSQNNEWQESEINQINRRPMHTHYFPYSNIGEAMRGQKEKSVNFISLNGKWKFNFAKDVTIRPPGFFQKDYFDGDWNSINVPGLWELSGYGDPLYKNAGYAWSNQFQSDPPKVPVENNHVGSYRKEIDIPAGWKGKKIFAHFGAVTSNIYLWINGKFVGYSEDSRLEAEFDVTTFVSPGRNLFAIQVFRWCDVTYLEDQDFFRYSGVSTNCYLFARNEQYFSDIINTPDLDDEYQNGKLKIETTFPETVSQCLTEFLLFDAYSNLVASEPKGKGVILLKRFNFNFVRTSHYLFYKHFYDLCDEYGIYLIAEAKLESHGMR